MGRVQVFIAASLDGFIAGPDDDLSWLPTDQQPGPGAIGFDTFLADVGAMLMGRRTYDTVMGFDAWPYEDMPVLVATTRELGRARPTVRRVTGSIGELLDEALQVADGRNVYVDGGNLVQQALAARRVDELIVTIAPVLLGRGVRLFGDLDEAFSLQFAPPTSFGSMVQLRAEAMS